MLAIITKENAAAVSRKLPTRLLLVRLTCIAWAALITVGMVGIIATEQLGVIGLVALMFIGQFGVAVMGIRDPRAFWTRSYSHR